MQSSFFFSMQSSFFLWLLVLCSASTAVALFEDDAGRLDFLIATAGHGAVSFVHASDQVVVTSDSSSSRSGSCYIASRSIRTGSLKWRRNVCSLSSSSEQGHATTAANGLVFTVDSSGSLKAWSVDDGALVWDAIVDDASHPRVWTFERDGKVYVATDNKAVFDAVTGESVDMRASSKADDTNHNEFTCMDARVSVAVNESGSSIQVWDVDASSGARKEVSQVPSLALSSQDSIILLSQLVCEKDYAALLISSKRGETIQLTMARDGSGAPSFEQKWRTEEGLSKVSSANLIDSSHYVGDMDSDTEVRLLEFQSRLAAQWRQIQSLVSFQFPSQSRVQGFGFVKTAVLLSPRSHRLYGVETVGESKGSIRYKIDLPENSLWHRMVHGAQSSRKALHGINGVTHGREILVLSLSSSKNSVSWICVDGATGAVHGQGSVAVSSEISQIVPLTGALPSKQTAMLLLANGGIEMIPNDEASVAAGISHIETSPNGFFVHTIDRAKSTLYSHLIVSTAEGLKSQPSGSVVFSGEEILQVTYPKRDEVIQSPCNVLGDDSLLLKYINPHLVVVITSGESVSEETSYLATALKSSQKTTTQKRKPAGVSGDVSSEGATEDAPNIFVNVVDAVSGRVLYRASHSNAVLYPKPSVTISENWVFYSFFNEKTRRAVIGVLSLYEGMIDSKGLTAFSSPEQPTSFSSLDAREAKPVVLSKSYSFAKPVTALGVTSTKSGISTPRLLVSCVDGHIYSLDRRSLEPRRPVGAVKESEKKEGLIQYSEFIPSVPYLSLSYNQTVESVSSIIAAPTDLESQSLVLAFGGPDLFFTRTSPSRGFDLLPESFNRVLLSLGVVGLLAVVVVLRSRAFKKMQSEGWL